MSSFIRRTKHPYTGIWENAWWIDDYYGRHEYGVRFPSDGKIYRESVYSFDEKEGDKLSDSS